MTIEFHCTSCGQLLKVPDTAAGRRAQCPKCDAAMAIPSGDAAATSAATVEPTATFDVEGGEAVTRAPLASTPYVPTRLDVKTVLSQTVALFKANIIGCTLAILIVWIVSAVLLIGITAGLGALAAMFDFDDLLLILSPPLAAMAAVWIKVGAIRYFITVARTGSASPKLLFSGSRGFAAFFSTGIVLALLCWIGLMLFVVPGVLIGLMLWPSVFLAVDRDLDLMRAYRTARMLTKGNIVSSLILFVIGYAIIAISPLALGIGGLFGMAFSVLLFAVMYNTLVTGGVAKAVTG
jgi:hypothetical protein